MPKEVDIIKLQRLHNELYKCQSKLTECQQNINKTKSLNNVEELSYHNKKRFICDKLNIYLPRKDLTQKNILQEFYKLYPNEINIKTIQDVLNFLTKE